MATDATVTTPKPAAHAFLGHAKLISLLTLVSRIFGVLRESVWANYFGTGVVSSAFTIAFTIPNLFRKLFGEGALSAAFIPLYTKALKTQTPEEANRFAAASVNLLCLALVVIIIIGEGILGSMIWLGHDMRFDLLLTLKLAAIMLPYVLLICGTAFLSAILQVHRRFGMPAAAPILLNICHITVMILGGWILGMPLLSHAPRPQEMQLQLANWLAGFVLIAGLLQIAILIPSLRAIGFRFQRVGWLWNEQIKRMLIMSIPVALAAGVLQISVLMDKGITAILSQGMDQARHVVTDFTLFGHVIRYPMVLGAVKRLDWAQVLYQFPLGVFAIALATAIFPGLSADALDKDAKQFKKTLRTGIEATLFEGFAASVGLIIVRYQAIRILLKYGAVTDTDVDLIARSLTLYASGIWAYSMQQIINRAYYALHDTRTPLLMSILNIVINLVVEIPLLWTMGEAGMAAGTTVSFAVQSILMLWMLRGRIGDFGLPQIVSMALRMLVAAGLMFGICWAMQQLPFWPKGSGRLVSLVQLILLMGVGAGVYLGVCYLLGVHLLHTLVRRKRAVA